MNRRRLWISIAAILSVAWGSAMIAAVAGWGPTLGLDLRGGFAVTLVAPEGTDDEVLDKAVEIMRQRIENLGSVQEPEISVQGNRAILVQLPGVEDRDRALEAVGTTGTLSFRPVLEIGRISPAFTNGTLPLPPELQAPTTTTTTTAPEATSTTAGDASTTTTQATTTTTTAAPVIPDNIDPDTGITIVDDIAAEGYLAGDDGLIYRVGPAFLAGADVTGAQAGFVGTITGGVIVDPEFTAEGATKFEDATAILSQFPLGDPRRQMAIVVDGVVNSAPSIDQSVAPGTSLDADQVYITIGTADNAQAEAEDLATILRYGALPTDLERERVESISASLGDDSLRAGLIAGIGALLVVAIGFVLYYRAFGILAIVGFTIFGSLLLLVLTLLSRLQGATLTLAGVTGIIVSIGITSDSYVVFFERVKEDHRKGRPLRPAVDQGFKSAFRTILTADFIAFAGSALLWILAIGPVKGFALTLGLATLIDVTVAYFFTRPASMLLVRSKLGHGDGFLTVESAMGGTP
ncbi:MAG: protein translocase subunit SecD, partial [Actinomycetota bacterium]|nr:protein translocase subunit SecD [Actinomycetota bacterium]